MRQVRLDQHSGVIRRRRRRRRSEGSPAQAEWQQLRRHLSALTLRSEHLEAALACGLDAEWPPEETTGEQRGGGPPHAT